MRAAALALLLAPAAAMAQPVPDDRLILAVERADFHSAPPPTGFQTRITRASIRDHLRDYRVRPLQDGVLVQRRFTIGR